MQECWTFSYSSGTGATLRSRLRIVNNTGICAENGVQKGQGEGNPLPKKRKAEDDNAGKEEGLLPAKKQKSITDDLICPITHDFPFDPVTAEDGRSYERTADGD